MKQRTLVSGLFGLTLAAGAMLAAPAQALMPTAPLAAQIQALPETPAAAVATEADMSAAKIDKAYYYVYRRHYRPRYHYHYRRHYRY